MTPPDDLTEPSKTVCPKCAVKRHLACQWRTRPGGCGCSCPWLVADMLAHFPSLRRAVLEETEDP